MTDTFLSISNVTESKLTLLKETSETNIFDEKYWDHSGVCTFSVKFKLYGYNPGSTGKTDTIDMDIATDLGTTLEIQGHSCEKDLWWIILLSVVGGIILLILLIVVICYCCCKKDKDDKEDKKGSLVQQERNPDLDESHVSLNDQRRN